jgi:hypothetical protein
MKFLYFSLLYFTSVYVYSQGKSIYLDQPKRINSCYHQNALNLYFPYSEINSPELTYISLDIKIPQLSLSEFHERKDLILDKLKTACLLENPNCKFTYLLDTERKVFDPGTSISTSTIGGNILSISCDEYDYL